MPTTQRIQPVSRAVFLALLGVVWLKTAFAVPALQATNWPEALLLLAATAHVLASVSRTLPFQNVLWAALVIGVSGGIAHAVGTLSSIPFGPFVFTPAAGPRLFEVVPATVLLLWVLLVLSARGTARLILKPWRKTRVYGFWLMGLTALLCLLLDLGLDPFASRMRHYWIWEPTRFPFDWHGMPLTNFAGWTVTALLIMAFVTPMLINKKPGQTPPEYGTLLVWVSLNALFVTASLTHGLRLAALASSLGTLAVVIMAVRGARW